MPAPAQYDLKYFFRSAFLAQVLLAIAIASAAQGPANTEGLVIDTIAERRVSDTSSQLVAADQLKIGDEIFYTIRVRNATNATLDGVVVVKAVPRNTEYVADSAVGPAATIDYSTDGGATFATPDRLEVLTQPSATRRASASDYTHLRWQLRHPLAAGATALLRFRGVFK